MEETRHIRKEDVLSRGIKKEQIIHSGPEENLSLQGKSAIKTATASKKVAASKIAPIETKGAINQNIETDKPVVYKNATTEKQANIKQKPGKLAMKKDILGRNSKRMQLVNDKNPSRDSGKTFHGLNKESGIKKTEKKNKKGIRIKNHKHRAKLQMKDAIKYKRIQQIMNSDDPSGTVESITKEGINKIVAMVARMVQMLLIAAGKLVIKLGIMLIPVMVFFAPVIFIVLCLAGFAGSSGARDRNLVFGITGDLNYVSYRQGNYEGQYGETGWCGITSFTDILASYGCTSPYEPSELINPCDTVRYADENGHAIIGEDDGVHYLNEGWYSALCGEYGLEFEAVRSDYGVYGETLLEWVNTKLDEGWQVVVCFDDYSKYESGAYITTNRHYVWLVCYADSNHETYACIDPGNGCADSTFLSEATTEGGYRDLIVNKSQILDYTGGTNYITGFAVRMPDGSGMDEFE